MKLNYPVCMAGLIKEKINDTAIKVKLQHYLPQGDRLYAIQESEPILDLHGNSLGKLWNRYGIVQLVSEIGKNEYTAKTLVTDGVTQIKSGDLLIAEGKQRNQTKGKLIRVNGWQVKGKGNKKAIG